VINQSRSEFTLVIAERIYTRLTAAQQQGQTLFPNLVTYKLLDPAESLQRLLQQLQVQQTHPNVQVSNVSQSRVSNDHVEMMEW